jgi:hypothetical protein
MERTPDSRPKFPRGSPEAILQALEETGGLQFERGELDELLSDIELSRLLDLTAEELAGLPEERAHIERRFPGWVAPRAE